MRYFVIIIVLLGFDISTLVTANDVGPVTSLRDIIIDEKNRIIVSAGQSDLFADKLNQLWEKASTVRVDKMKQPWKRVDLPSLEAIFGPIPRRYVIAATDYVFCREPSGCKTKMGPFRVYETEVKGAELFESYCGGIFSVLDLGVWPWKKSPYDNWPTAVAISLAPHELPVIGKLDLASVPQELAANFNSRATGITLKLPKAGKQFALIYSETESETEYSIFNVIQKSETDKDQIINELNMTISCH